MSQEEIKGFFIEASCLIKECAAMNAAVIESVAAQMIDCFEQGRKVLLCGNGGSASQAQHFAAELVNKLSRYRRALSAVSLTTDTSVLTSIGNDLSFDMIFARQVEALGSPGDIVWGLSTSGASANVLEAFRVARDAGLTTIAFVGAAGSAIEELADVTLTVPARDTARIQEVHLCSGHAVCAEIEAYYLKQA
ncbi:MAG: SIS domain-containing protein [Deltaproteobacteria bacterium]|nr:SIS domain-containing protein [Deltaproteobacteria bacterium]